MARLHDTISCDLIGVLFIEGLRSIELRTVVGPQPQSLWEAEGGGGTASFEFPDSDLRALLLVVLRSTTINGVEKQRCSYTTSEADSKDLDTVAVVSGCGE